MELAFLPGTRDTAFMTEGEITFHLREILGAWTAPRITATTAAELERQHLIEFSEERRLVRLTPEGVQRKLVGRQMTEDPRPARHRQRQRPQPQGKRPHGKKPQGKRSHGKKRSFVAPRPLV